MGKVEIKLSTPKEVMEVTNDTLKHTSKCWSVFQDGELIAVAGIMHTPTVKMAFSEMKPDVKISDITIWKTALLLWQNMKALGYKRLYTVANPELSTAPDFLARLGWTSIGENKLGEVFLWESQQ